MKSYCAILCLFLSACTGQKEWIYRNVMSRTPQFESSCLHYQPENRLTGVGIEFLNGSFGTVGYLNVTCRQIPSLPEDSEAAVVVLEVEKEKFPYKAIRMEGGQRLLLPQEATEKLISALSHNHAVTIYLEGYMTQVTVSNFPKFSQMFQER